MKFRIIGGFAVIPLFALFGFARTGAVLVDPALKDVQQFLKGQYANTDNPEAHHLPTAGPNYVAQTTTFVGQPIVVQNEVKVLERPSPAQSTPTVDYGPVDKSDISHSGFAHKSPDKISVTILKEFSLGAVPGSKGPSANIQYDIQREHSSPVHHQPQAAYGAGDITSSGYQSYNNPPPIQEFIDQHTQYSGGQSHDLSNNNYNNQEINQYNQNEQVSLQQESNNDYGQTGQQSNNNDYQQQNGGIDQGLLQQHQQFSGEYDQQLNGGYQQQQQQQIGGYSPQQQQTGGYEQQQQQTGGYEQQQQQTGGYEQQQQQTGGYEQQQQQTGGYAQQQQQTDGYAQQEQQIGAYSQQQQQTGGYAQQQQLTGSFSQQQQQQIGGYDQTQGNGEVQQQQLNGGYNSNQVSNLQSAAVGGYNNQVQQQKNTGYNNNGLIQQQSLPQQQNNGGYAGPVQQQQNNGGNGQTSLQQQNGALFQKQESNINGQGVIQQALLTTHGQLLQQNSQQLVQSLGFGPVLEQADLVFKSETPQQSIREQETVQQAIKNPVSQSSNNQNQYGVPNQPQSQNLNTQYGAPNPPQSQNLNTQYGAPAQSQSQNLNTQYGAPNQSPNSNSSPMEGWTPLRPQFSRTHYVKGGDQGKSNPWSSKTASISKAVQGGYSDNVNAATKDYRVNNLIVDKSGVSQTYNSDKAAKVIIHAQNVIIKSDIPVEKTAIYGNTRDITPLLKEQLKTLMHARGQQLQQQSGDKDSSITAKTNAFVAIPNYFKPSQTKTPLPLNNIGANSYRAPGAGGYANQQISGGYSLAASVQQASAFYNNNNNNNGLLLNNNNNPKPLAPRIPNDYGAGLIAPLPYAASNNIKVATGPPSPPNDYNAGLSAPPIGTSASTSSNNYAPPPSPVTPLAPNSSPQSRPKTPAPANDYHAGLYAPPPIINGGSGPGSHIPEGKIIGEPVSLKSQFNENTFRQNGKGGPPRFKSGRPGSTRDYGSSVSYFSSGLGEKRPEKLQASESQLQNSENQDSGESLPVYFGNNEHPFAHLAKKPHGFGNSSSRGKFRYRPAKRPQLFSISFGNDDKRPGKIVQGASIDLQDITSSSSSNTKTKTNTNYKYKQTTTNGKPNYNQGSGLSFEFTDPYTRLGKNLFYNMYEMLRKSAPSFQTIASIPRVITSTMKKIPPVRLEIYRN